MGCIIIIYFTGSQGNQWLNASLEFQNTEQVVFLGSIGNGWGSDMALDDLTITLGSCVQRGESRP